MNARRPKFLVAVTAVAISALTVQFTNASSPHINNQVHKVAAKESISVAEAWEDVDELFKNLEDVHPDLLAKVRANDYLDLKRRVVTEVTTKFNRDGAIRFRDLAYSLFYAIAFFQDGHTRIDWWTLREGVLAPNSQSAAGMRFPPFLIKFQYGRFYIDQALEKDLIGLQIAAINGVPIMQFLRPILDRYSGETSDYKAATIFRAGWIQKFWWFLTDILSPAKELTATFIRQPAVKFERSLSTIDFNAFHALAKTSDQAASDKTLGTRVAFLDGGQIALFTCPEFKWTQDEKENIDHLFQEIKDKQSHALIVDIRGNGGGKEPMGKFIMQYLTTKKFRANSRDQVKISRRVFNDPDCRIKTGYDCANMSPLIGLLITNNFEEEELKEPAAFYQGRVYLLVDNGTYSAASNFAAWLRDYEVGEIIGYETGYLTTNFCEMFKMSLKNSGIPYWVSYKKFYSPHPRPGDDEHGVIPNIVITDEILEKYKDQKDPILAFTIDHIKSQK